MSQQPRETYETCLQAFCTAMKDVRSNTRAINYDANNKLTNCSDYFNAYCLLNNGKAVSTRGHKHLLNEIVDVTTNDNDEEVRTGLDTILNSKANINHTHNASTINYTYEEEENYEEETINEEEEVVIENKTRTITRSVPLNNVLTDADQ